MEIEPMREPGGYHAVDPEWSVTTTLTQLAEDIGLKFSTVKSARWTSSRWPADRRQKGVSYTVHRILAYIENDQERFDAILTPPGGKLRWTPDDASRRVGNRVETPVTPKEKITAIHTLAQDAQVAAAVTSDFLKRPEVTAKVTTVDKARVVEEFTRDEHVATTAATNLLRRPDVAFKAMSDDTARFQVNHAQAERSRQARDHFEDTSPVAPAVKKIDRTVEFLDLVTACHSFVAAAGRTVPGLRDRTLSEDEATIVHQNVAKVNGWPPLIWTRADGYQLGAERAALEAYERAVLTEKLTEFRRFITGTVAPHAATHPGDKWVKHIIAQLNSIESTLDLVVSS